MLTSSLLAIDRKEYESALQDARAAAANFTVPDERTRLNLVLVHLPSGIAEARAGRPAQAQSHLESLRLHHRQAIAAEKWWRAALESEIAIAEGRWHDAADTYAAGEPVERMYTSISRAPSAFVLTYNLPSRDSRARALSARGDLNAAIQEYRRLNTIDSGPQWVAALEPKYVLEIARLLGKVGDAEEARREYRRFLDLWKHADPGLPELAEARRGAQ
jgi:tetratricopeptide (TPR) repeat protein